MHKRKDINAILLAIYLWMFIVLRIVWAFNSNYSTIILGIISILIICVSIINSEKFINITFLKGIIIFSSVIFFLLIDMLFRNNEILNVRLYEFLIYGVIPILLLSQIRNFGEFFKTYVIFSVIVFFVYVLDPINQYFLSSSYMVYGFQAMLPAFMGLHIGRKEFGLKPLIILEIMAFIMMLFFGNRMAGIAALIFVILIDLLYKRRSAKKNIKYFFFICLVITIIMNIQPIAEKAANILNNNGYSSYSINSIIFYLNGTIDSLSSGRNILWENAIDLIKENPIIGYGVGYYESMFNIYVHNFFLEITLSYGLLGIFTYMLMLFYSCYRIIKNDDKLKLFGILLFCTSFPKLFTSHFIFEEPTFWMFIFYGVYSVSISFERNGKIGYRKRVTLNDNAN
ncbi:O-antigen ligase family protein [Guptibacillus hwajinpoensis]|uniref:O-antigen ligase family protein n=1 Tax=Guptibacillus hwajinpoensis TaxID=208199 RepID=UPI003736E174